MDWLTPDVGALRFEERLNLLLEHEAAERDNYRIANRLRVAKLPQSATLEDFDTRLPRDIDPSMLSTVRDLGWITDEPAAIAARRMHAIWFARRRDSNHRFLRFSVRAKALQAVSNDFDTRQRLEHPEMRPEFRAAELAR